MSVSQATGVLDHNPLADLGLAQTMRGSREMAYCAVLAQGFLAVRATELRLVGHGGDKLQFLQATYLFHNRR